MAKNNQLTDHYFRSLNRNIILIIIIVSVIPLIIVSGTIYYQFRASYHEKVYDHLRELANTIEKTLIFSRGAPIQAEDVIQALSGEKVTRESDPQGTEDAIRRWMRTSMTSEAEAHAFEKIMDHFAGILVSEALNLTDGNRSRAAKLLGLSRPTLHSKIEKYGLKLKTSVDEE